jgi:hypothetical protein
MAITLRTSLFILLFGLIVQLQFNLDADKTATRQIKNALELAVHDAGLSADPTALSSGQVIFQQSLALDNLQKSLEANLKISSTAGYVYTPKEDSFFKNDLYLVHLEFIDDSINTTYPYIYTNPDYDLLEVLNGPSIIAVMTTESPRWFKGNQTFIRQPAVYEYKR